ncbi:MAG TPA: hypothetical protein VF781_03865, partial [Solirubrobacteraceae bacterium]
MRNRIRVGALAATAGAALAVGLPVASGTTRTTSHRPAQAAHERHTGRHRRAHGQPSRIQHVLLLSVDGLHQSDLSWYVKNHPGSALAHLAHLGMNYTQAR